MTDDEQVLAAIDRFNEPMGWYPIAIELRRHKVTLTEKVQKVLERLEANGSVVAHTTDNRTRYTRGTL